MIERRRLGRTDLSVSVLGFGAAPIGFVPQPDMAAFTRLIRRAVELGINFFDTAPDYRESESMLGDALTGIHDAIVATKVGRLQALDARGRWYAWQDWSESGVVHTIEESLRRLRLDVLDLVQLHSPELLVLMRGEALQGLQRARQQGKLRHIGVSADGAEAAYAIKSGAFAALQISYSVLEQRPDELVDEAVAASLGVIIKQPVANGIADLDRRPEHPHRASTWQVAQKMDLSPLGRPGERTVGALRWLVADRRIGTAIVGTTNIKHLEQNAAAVEAPLASEAFERLRAAFRSVD